MVGAPQAFDACKIELNLARPGNKAACQGTPRRPGRADTRPEVRTVPPLCLPFQITMKVTVTLYAYAAVTALGTASSACDQANVEANAKCDAAIKAWRTVPACGNLCTSATCEPLHVGGTCSPNCQDLIDSMYADCGGRCCSVICVQGSGIDSGQICSDSVWSPGQQPPASELAWRDFDTEDAPDIRKMLIAVGCSSAETVRHDPSSVGRWSQPSTHPQPLPSSMDPLMTTLGLMLAEEAWLAVSSAMLLPMMQATPVFALAVLVMAIPT